MAGGYSRWSGAVTGILVLVALMLAGILEPLPRAVLGATVVAAVIPLIKPQRILRLWRPSRPAFLIAGATFVSTLILSPHVEQGVMVGVGLSIVVHLWRELRVDTVLDERDGILNVRPEGVLWFGASQAMQDRVLRELAGRDDLRGVLLHLDAVGRLDITAAMSLRAILDEARRLDLSAEVTGVRERDERLVTRVVHAEATI